MKVAETKILITGGGSGIGRYLVESFSRDGARVATLEYSAEAVASWSEFFPEVPCLQCDVTDPVAVESAIRRLGEDHDFSPEVLINNAGIIHSEPLVNLLRRDDPRHDMESWRRTVSGNLDSTFVMTRELAALWVSRRTRGVVVSVSSISARGNAGQSAYAAAKAGINALTVTWSKELGCFGLRFNAVAPGFFDTESTRRAVAAAKLEQIAKSVPLGRLGELAELYSAVRFLVENDYANGIVLDLNGGLVI